MHSPAKRIASFLPSATETLFALGAGDQVVAVSFDCDFPAQARTKPVVVHSHLAEGLAPAEIDAQVRSAAAESRTLYLVDLEALEQMAPDLVIVQDLCHVCALDSPTLARDLSRLPSHPQVLSLSGNTLEEVLADIERLGRAAGRGESAAALLHSLRERLDAVARRVRQHQRRPRVLALEWLNPLFQGGHWVPEMIALAGGDPVLATAGSSSTRVEWTDVIEAQPEIIVLMPCGFDLRTTLAQYRDEVPNFPAAWHQLPAVRDGRLFAVDGNAFFSRPGPRLVDGLEILDAIVNGRGFDQLPLDSVAAIPSPRPLPRTSPGGSPGAQNARQG